MNGIPSVPSLGGVLDALKKVVVDVPHDAINSAIAAGNSAMAPSGLPVIPGLPAVPAFPMPAMPAMPSNGGPAATVAGFLGLGGSKSTPFVAQEEVPTDIIEFFPE